MDNKLNWKEHICMIKSKLAKSNAIIYRGSKYLDTFSLKIVYCFLFMPSYFSYCSENWGKTYIPYINSLYSLQKKSSENNEYSGEIRSHKCIVCRFEIIKTI